jgi:hypothetical protein
MTEEKWMAKEKGYGVYESSKEGLLFESSSK